MTPVRRFLQASTLATGFAIVYFALGYVQFYHWLLTDGLLFALLLVLARRWWPALFVATIVARILSGVLIFRLSGIHGPVLGYWQDWPQFLLGNVAEPFLVATGVLLLRRRPLSPAAPLDLDAIARLHVAALASALAVVAKDLLYVINDGVIADVTRGVIHDPIPIGHAGTLELMSRFAIKNALGVFIGIMLLAPLAWWWKSPAERAGSAEAMRDAQRLAVPCALLFVLLGLLAKTAPMAELLRLLLMVVIAISALRRGWRGAALAILAVSLAVAIDDHLDLGATAPLQLQAFIAIAGAIGLMFGAAINDLRRQKHALEAARASATSLANDLAAAASGSLYAEEGERHRIAADLHDEFGQNLTALQTHLQLVKDDFQQAGKGAALEQLMELTRAMRRNIREVLERLRPAVLDELGLYGAINQGSMRHLAEDAGLQFHVQLQGDARLLARLDDSYRIAAYRLVQEAVTNTVRHAYARHCSVRLRAEHRGDALCLFLDVRDDGTGRIPFARPGTGLKTMRDRVVALGGRLHTRNLAQGLRVHALLRQQLGNQQDKDSASNRRIEATQGSLSASPIETRRPPTIE